MRWFAEEEAPARPVTFLDKVCSLSARVTSSPVSSVASSFTRAETKNSCYPLSNVLYASHRTYMYKLDYKLRFDQQLHQTSYQP